MFILPQGLGWLGNFFAKCHMAGLSSYKVDSGEGSEFFFKSDTKF